ncbi:unnamed protein product [Haemonchus placei]|uniref:V-SNARE coiled-coil homology domain-containing protein n=1 Tax=Haemonchus placei TaxID=6290 RepID=A0A0N4W7F1_HAEPC|nr:unnamed protein product [Haemonchus placei]
MRILTILLVVGLWRAAVLEETNNAKSLFKSIMEVDRALAEEIKSDISEAKDKKDQLKDQLSQEIQNTVQNLKDALKEKVDKVREIEKAYKDQKSADKKQAYEDWKNLIQGINETKVAWEEEKENKIAEVEKEIQQLLNALRLEYEEIKKQRATQQKDDQEKYRQACQEKMEEMGCIQEASNGSSSASSGGRKHQKESTLEESLKTTFAMDKIEDVLDKVKAKRQNSVLVEPRATVLDEITGVSAWQTVTWILLALCIIMGVALIAMIVYQVAHHNKYHHLDGSNHPGERTPIARNMGPGYLGEGKSSPTPMSSAPPPGETQQF